VRFQLVKGRIKTATVTLTHLLRAELYFPRISLRATCPNCGEISRTFGVTSPFITSRHKKRSWMLSKLSALFANLSTLNSQDVLRRKERGTGLQLI